LNWQLKSVKNYSRCVSRSQAGCHGSNWGAKAGGGYYAYITSQHSNILTVVDPDPDNNNDGSDAEIVAQIVLANGSPTAGITDGSGGQGILPIPLVSNGWIQDTVACGNDGRLSITVQGFIDALTSSQQNPDASQGSCTIIGLVGGELNPVDTSTLLLAGAQMNAAWLIPAIVAAVGIGIVIARKF